MSDRLAWTGYAAAGCVVVRLPLHLYYALGGDAGLSVVDDSVPTVVDPGRLASGSASLRPVVGALPDWLSPTAAAFAWRGAHLATAVLLAAVAVLALALVRPWGRRLPTPALIMSAFAVTVAALGYALAGIVSYTGPVVSGALPSGLRDLGERVFLSGDPAGRDWWPGGDGLAGLMTAVRPSAPERALLGYADWLGHLPSAYPLGGLTAPGPWALAVGLLFALAATRRLGTPAIRIWLLAIALAVLRLAL